MSTNWKARAESAEAERDEWRTKALDVEKHPVVVALVEDRDALRRRAERAEHISDECANQNAALRAALAMAPSADDYRLMAISLSASVLSDDMQAHIAKYERLRESALALTPPAAGDAGKAVSASPNREFGFNRYVGGRLMAEGVVVHAENLEQAAAKASRMVGTRGTVLLLREEDTCEK